MEKKFDIWLYGRDVGWWLQEEGYYTPEYAAQALGKWIRVYDHQVFGAILPSGEPIDLPFAEDTPNDRTREIVPSN